MERVLCGSCAAKLGYTKLVVKVRGGVDEKVDCSECGRRRFGGVFEVKQRSRRRP